MVAGIASSRENNEINHLINALMYKFKSSEENEVPGSVHEREATLSLHSNRPTPVGTLHRGQGPSEQDWVPSESRKELFYSALTSRELPFG